MDILKIQQEIYDSWDVNSFICMEQIEEELNMASAISMELD